MLEPSYKDFGGDFIDRCTKTNRLKVIDFNRVLSFWN